jgi:hypothetical protein
MLNLLMGVVAMAGSASGTVPERPGDAQVVELRQYQIVEGKRDAFVALFGEKLTDSQEAVGMSLVGQFVDHDDPRRFTWLRGFRDLASRAQALNSFYFGPVWQANREAANSFLVDNDNVLLLAPATPDLAFAPASADGASDGGAVWAVVEYLWKTPDEGFSTFFHDKLKPALDAGGVTVVAAYVPLDAPNNFPRLPVRNDRKLLVWFVRGDSHEAILARLDAVRQSSGWRETIEEPLREARERAPQILRLDPTPRSRLR